jgi:CheY-like chemotaxis protein
MDIVMDIGTALRMDGIMVLIQIKKKHGDGLKADEYK